MRVRGEPHWQIASVLDMGFKNYSPLLPQIHFWSNEAGDPEVEEAVKVNEAVLKLVPDNQQINQLVETSGLFTIHPGLAEIFAPDGVTGSDIIS